MDPRLLQYYNLELQHLRETGAEFAQQFPKIAARLGITSRTVATLLANAAAKLGTRSRVQTALRAAETA